MAHGVLGLMAVSLSAARREGHSAPPPTTEMLVVELPRTPEPDPDPEPEAPPEPDPEPPRARMRAPKPAPAPPPNEEPPSEEPPNEEPPPAAAEAANVLALSPQADEVVDFGDTFVLGNADRYAGGVSAAGGTSMRAVRDKRARAHGAIGGTGNDPVPMVDRSRSPGLAGGARWDCPFPREADMAGMNDGVVTLRVSVAADGSVERALVERDPGFGFGREARRCALRKRWLVGLDRAGKPITAVARVRVRFTR